MRKIFALILAAAMCLSLAACGASDSADTTQTDGGFEKQSIKISYSTGDQGMDGIPAMRSWPAAIWTVCLSSSFRVADMTCAFSARRLWRA